MKSLIRVAVLAAALVWASGPSTSAATLLFPDGAQSEAFPVPGGTAFVLFGNEFSPQIYLQFADFAGNALFSSVPGVPPAFAYGLQLTGALDEFNRRIYDLWIDQGSGFFFVEQVVVSGP